MCCSVKVFFVVLAEHYCVQQWTSQSHTDVSQQQWKKQLEHEVIERLEKLELEQTLLKEDREALQTKGTLYYWNHLNSTYLI